MSEPLLDDMTDGATSRKDSEQPSPFRQQEDQSPMPLKRSKTFLNRNNFMSSLFMSSLDDTNANQRDVPEGSLEDWTDYFKEKNLVL